MPTGLNPPRKGPIGIVAVLLIVSIGNYLRMQSDNVRVVEFVSILAIGALAGILLMLIVSLLKNRA